MWGNEIIEYGWELRNEDKKKRIGGRRNNEEKVGMGSDEWIGEF
jgi:hypothetical protein